MKFKILLFLLIAIIQVQFVNARDQTLEIHSNQIYEAISYEVNEGMTLPANHKFSSIIATNATIQ